MLKPLLVTVSLASATLGCARHNYHEQLAKRGDKGGPESADWSYDASFDWGRVSPEYVTCQTGTAQSPLALSRDHGLSSNHIPTFNYPNKTTGTFSNWGYGPSFTVQHPEGVWTGNPSVAYDNETVYLVGWHIHTPADHSINNYRTRAELHLVHADAEGNPKAVFAIMLDPGHANDPFFDQLPSPLVRFNETEQWDLVLSLPTLLSRVNHFDAYMTYSGSLTSPPCHEGIRWFVAQQVVYTSVEQMQRILGASTYSARQEQFVWQHRINE